VNTSSKLLPALLLAFTSVAAIQLAAQTPAPAYNPKAAFAPLVLPDAINSYRSSNGAPGPMYWQNRADYELHATIDTATKTLTGSEVITYTNNSPDMLTSLWLHLEQNIYRTDSRSGAASSFGRRRSTNVITSTEGDVLDSVEIQTVGQAKSTPVKAFTVVSDTRLQIQLPEGEGLAHGVKIRILIHWHYTIPGIWGGRTSWATYKQGDIYDIAQWYPRMCVYDDLHGWDTQPYLGNEFYLEYGHFDYFVTVPANMLVNGSGELINAKDVLTATEMSRLAEARKSDKTVMIRTPDEVTKNVALPASGTKTWHFAMDSTRDVVFSASQAFVWDAARMNIPAGAGKPAHVALAQSIYPAEAGGDAGWGRSTEYTKDTVERMSARWYPYVWPNAVSIAGGSSGMEYPGVVFDGPSDKGKGLFWITAHEFGHSWFPMMVGSNERRHAWMDEGFNTFIDTFESDDFESGVYGPKRDSEFAPDPNATPADQIARLLLDQDALPIVSRADNIGEKYRHSVTYFKTAFGLRLLRDNILGPVRFDHAFRKYIADWAFKHPAPSDFFRAMESEGGEDLSWFWRGYFFHNWQLDLAITDVQFVEDDPATGVRVTVANRGQMVLPSTLRVMLANGSHVDVAVPAETWMQQTSHVFTVKTTSRAVSATIDPDHAVPDIDRSNNMMALPK
jgi:hypothetical protein